MTNLSKEICFRFAKARRDKGLSQTVLSRKVGCTQSALSMFEAGMPTKLSDEIVQKLSKELGVPLVEEKKDSPPQAPLNGMESVAGIVVHGYCPNCNCPSNVPYVVDGRLFYRPSRRMASPTGGVRCTQCGEVLELRCPVCGAPLNDGACCAVCGSSYVTPTLPEGVDAAAYARVRRDEISQLRQLA